MKKISSNFTFFYKRIFPITWLGFVILVELGVITALFINKTPIKGETVLSITVPIFMFIIGFYFFYYLLFRLVDEVYFDDTSLLFVNGSRKTRIPFNEVKKINYLRTRPPRIEVILYNEDKESGKTLYFAPPTRILGLIKHPDVEMFFEKFHKSKS